MLIGDEEDGQPLMGRAVTIYQLRIHISRQVDAIGGRISQENSKITVVT